MLARRGRKGRNDFQRPAGPPGVGASALPIAIPAPERTAPLNMLAIDELFASAAQTLAIETQTLTATRIREMKQRNTRTHMRIPAFACAESTLRAHRGRHTL